MRTYVDLIVDRHVTIVQSILDDKGDETGDYRLVVDGKPMGEFFWDEDISHWIEIGKGNTALADKVGTAIEDLFLDIMWETI
jgi:hypothetical protein